MHLILPTLTPNSPQKHPRTHTSTDPCCPRRCRTSSRDSVTTDRLQAWEMLVEVSRTHPSWAACRTTDRGRAGLVYDLGEGCNLTFNQDLFGCVRLSFIWREVDGEQARVWGRDSSIPILLTDDGFEFVLWCCLHTRQGHQSIMGLRRLTTLDAIHRLPMLVFCE